MKTQFQRYAAWLIVVLFSIGFTQLAWADDTTDTRNAGDTIVSKAKKEIRGNDRTKYGAQANDPWCSEFVDWVYGQSGHPFGTTIIWTGDLKEWFEGHSLFAERGTSEWNSITPKPGDWVYFERKKLNDPEKTYHSGIVESVSGTTLNTIEGNRGGSPVARYSVINYKTADYDQYDAASNVYYGYKVIGFGMRHGKGLRRTVDDASASSSGDDREPENAFDEDDSTFWRNRTEQSGRQHLIGEFDFSDPVQEIEITFGNHYPAEYKVFAKRNGSWGQIGHNMYTADGRGTYHHDEWDLLQDVTGVKIQCYEYSSDDYFSILEMVIRR